MMPLTNLDDDTVIHILSFLSPSDLLIIRKTCKRMCALTKLRIIWTNACIYHILGQGYPFPDVALNTFSTQELEQHVCHAAQLAKRMLSHDWVYWRKWTIDTTSNTSVTDIRLMPGSEGTVMFTLSKVVWSAVNIWQLEPVTSRSAGTDCSFRKCCEWSPRGAIFNGFALNSSPSAEARIAISVVNNGEYTVELLSLEIPTDCSDWSLRTLMSFPSTFKPITLQGDLLAMSNNMNETIIFNWRTRAYATLQHNRDERQMWQHDKCIQIVFAYQSILVVRARSLHLFPYPILKLQEEGQLTYNSIAQHSFGWVDGVSVKFTNQHRISSSSEEQLRSQALSILVRAETDDPWSFATLAMDLHTLLPNPDYIPSDPSNPLISRPSDSVSNMTSPLSPYIFPPLPKYRISSGTRRGALLCTNIILGKLGTAIWIQPKERYKVGLYWTEDDPLFYGRNMGYTAEALFTTVFPGSLTPVEDKDDDVGEEVVKVRGRAVCVNEQIDWSSMDYDEDVGRIVLGSASGEITVLDI